MPAAAQPCPPVGGSPCTTNWVVQGNLSTSIASVSAAGSSQGTATALTKQTSVATAVAANTGVQILPGTILPVINRGANPMNVYPPSGAQIGSAGTNNPVVIPVNSAATFSCETPTQCEAY